MAAGIVSWGTYLPYWRLQRQAIGAAFGTGGGKGSRAVASYDEDTTTLGVEAARRALAPEGVAFPDDLLFSTPDPAYLDKTNATTIHAALGLDPATGAYDLCGSVRSSWATLRLAALNGERRPCLAVVADLRTGLAGGAEESQAGDGAAAFLFAPSGGVAEVLGQASATDEFLDRWRVPGETASRQWEDRFGEEALVPPARAAFAEALRLAGLGAEDVDHLVVAGLHARAVTSVRSSLGVDRAHCAPDYGPRIGNLGAAQAATGLADVLERATPGQVVAVVGLADGADVIVLRTTPALVEVQAGRRRAGLVSVAEATEQGRGDLPYASVSDLAGATAARAAPSARPRAPRRSRHAAQRGLEVRLRRQSLPAVRVRTPAAHPGVPFVPFRRPDGTPAAGRRTRHRRHLYRRSAGIQPLAAHGRGNRRFRRWGPVPRRDDRCRSRLFGHRHPGRDDVPAVLHRSRRA